MKVRDKVEQILRDYPKTRNSDKELRKQFGKTFYNLTDEQLSVFDIFAEDFETIRRNRQWIQSDKNDGGKYKAEKEVQQFRKEKRADYEVENGYNPTGEIGVNIKIQDAEFKQQEKMFW